MNEEINSISNNWPGNRFLRYSKYEKHYGSAEGMEAHDQYL